MTGSGVPAEFFHATSALGKTVLIGTSRAASSLLLELLLVAIKPITDVLLHTHATSSVLSWLQHWELLGSTQLFSGVRSRSQMTTASSFR